MGQLDELSKSLTDQGITNVNIIAIGKGQYSADNSKWIAGNSIPIVEDPSPNNLWSSWGASQWDVFIIDSKGVLNKKLNINPWNEAELIAVINQLLVEEQTLKNYTNPKHYELLEIYPNPFNPSTVISFSINEHSYVHLKVLNVMGNELETLNNSNLGPGYHKILWDGAKYPSGIYFINLETKTFSTTQKIILSK
mgnify:CR=1 FL=1